MIKRLSLIKKILLLLIIIPTFSIFFSSCSNRIAKEKEVTKLFLNKGYYNSDGNYTFNYYNSLDTVSFSYGFTYYPQFDLFNCDILVTTYSDIKMYDYASATFKWNDFENARFYAYHELDNVARIEFSYYNLDFSKKTLGDQYSYTVESNTYVNLTEKEEIDNRAATSYDCLKQAVSYMQQVLKQNGLNPNLW